MASMTPEMSNGLRVTTPADMKVFRECMASAIPFTSIWENRDDQKKIIEWDDEWEKYLQHRSNLIEADGREKYLPWNAYKELGLNWVDGYSFAQTRGDCCIPKGSLIATAYGNRRIEDLTTMTSFPSYSKTRETFINRQGHSYHTGIRKCVRVIVEDGVSFEMSSDHKVMTVKGKMIPAGELREGDLIFTAAYVICDTSLTLFTDTSRTCNRVKEVKQLGELDCYDIEIQSDEPDDGRDWTAHNFLLAASGSTTDEGRVVVVKNCSMGHKNSLKASNLTNALRTGRKPKEIAQSVAYAFARGGGDRPVFGDGANLIPMAEQAAIRGNYWTSDFGKYDGGRYVGKYDSSSDQDTHAKQTQSIIAFLPSPSFDVCWKVVRAGFGINIGSGTWPNGSKKNKDGLAQVSSWGSGGHSIALIAGWETSTGNRYIYLENSHPTAYASDDLNSGHQWGCWIDASDLKRMAGNGGFNYGNWYANIGELTR